MPSPVTPKDLFHKVRVLLRTDWRAQLVALFALLLILLHFAGVFDIWAFIHRYQALLATVLTGLFGFYTVNTTLRTNAEIAKKQKEDDRKHEQEAVRVALLAELEVIARTLRAKRSTDEQFEKDSDYAIARDGGMDSCQVYRALIGKIGLLPPRKLELVVTAYSEYEDFLSNAKWLKEQQIEHQTDTSKPCHFYTTYTGLLKGCIPYLEKAVTSLEDT